MKLRSIKIILLSVGFLVIQVNTSAIDIKETFNNIYINTKVHYGFIVPHHESITYLLEKHIPGFELEISRPAYGKHIWEQLYRYPRTGIGYFFCDYGNPEVLGQAHALYGFINIPVIKKGDNFYLLNYEISFGASYLTKKFDVRENHLNTVVGANLNVYFRLGLDTKIPLSKKLELTGEVGFSHCSNGKWRSPNYGLNVITGSLGLNYFLSNTNKEKVKLELPKSTSKNYYSIIYSAGAKVFDNLYNNYYFISSLSVDYERHLNLKRRIGIGADIFYDKSISEALAVDGELNEDIANLFKFGLHGSHTLVYNRLSMILNIGRYLYSKYTDLSLFYSRAGVRYKLTNHFLLNISLKAHNAKADFVEWGVGYIW